MSETILDSGNRREFDTGAVRDVAEGKGRCDLLPLDVICQLVDPCAVLEYIDTYVRSGDDNFLFEAISAFIRHSKAADFEGAMLELSQQYEAGCAKYGERNWEKGIPLHCYIDSGVRHYLKYLRGDTDEPHDRAFLWNMVGCIWTQRNRPGMIDLPFKDKSVIEVKRVAEFGEWIKIIRGHPTVSQRYRNGDILKVIKEEGGCVYVLGEPLHIDRDEYVVLEGYTPEDKP